MQRLCGLVLNFIYLTLVVALAPWLLDQAFRKQKYRAGFGQKFLGRVPRREGNRPCIWLHAVSVGEVNLLGSLLAELEQVFPEAECVISTTTLTGYQVARSKYADRLVFYAPLDFSWAVRTAMRRIRPDLLVLAELELWPNLIWAARAAGARVAVINGRLSDRSFRGYRRFRRLVGWLLRGIDLIAAQNEQYAERFRALGAPAERVVVTGSMKFDGARFDRQNAQTKKLAELAGVSAGDVVFLAGSTGAPEEEVALSVFQTLAPEYPRLRLIVVPRHPERFDEVERLIQAAGARYSRRSRLGATEGMAEQERILLVDTVGELGAWWGTAQIAFVGGSLNRRGGQNMIEPAAFGAAICFGPNTRNFRDIVAVLLAAEAATVVRNAGELMAFVRHCLESPADCERLGQIARALVRAQQGATGRTAERLRQLLIRPAMAEVRPIAA